MVCHDRYFMLAMDLGDSTEGEPRFAAVDGKGVYPITKQYAAKCGYNILIHLGKVELRASYFSCHTENNDDEVFMFNFNMIVMDKGKEVTYALNKTCSLPIPWSSREVTCEINYMEVSVRREVPCPTVRTKKDDQQIFPLGHGLSMSDWQVMFQRAGQHLPPMSLSKAQAQGYVFDFTDGRLVFRTPYGQPDSFSTEVNGVPVEVVNAILFSRKSWFVFMVDFVASCSLFEGSYDNGYMVWKTPEMLYPSLNNMRISVGLSGELVEQKIAKERGFDIGKDNGTIQIRIPYDMKGHYSKSFVTDKLYRFYVFNLYFEQILVDENHLETRLQFHRMLATPLLPWPVFTNNLTVIEEGMFNVYLGNFPSDVQLTAVVLNGQESAVSFTNTSTPSFTKVVQPNNTHGYTLKVPFANPTVVHKFSKKDGAFQYLLNINYTLVVLPENERFYHLTSLAALFTQISPPVLDPICSESGISFKLKNGPFNYLWDMSIGPDLLTAELAARRGYSIHNDSQSLLLTVPLFTHGYEYKDITLSRFFGSFEILMRDHETWEIQSSTVKTCLFSTTELIVCSTDGKMTVVADLSQFLPSEGSPAQTSLIDRDCRPKETDNTRALFSFPLNACGSIITLARGNVTYQNEIFYNRKYVDTNKAVSNATESVMMQCTYPLAGLHRLFSAYKFESDASGVGSIVHTKEPTAGLTIKSSLALRATRAPKRPMHGPKRPSRTPLKFVPAVHPAAYYIRVKSIN